jgi:putative hydrolase of the HAD superfamily
MIRLVTFDAAGTLIEQRLDPGALAARIIREHGEDVSDQAGSQAYQEIQERFREERELAERLHDKQRVRDVWMAMVEDWMRVVGTAALPTGDLLDELLHRSFSGEGHVFALYDDVLPTLDELDSMGIASGVISNWDHTLHVTLKRLGVSHRFAFAIASLEFGAEKPDPRIFQHALELREVQPNEALHVGDSLEDDYRGALGAGLRAVLLSRNHSKPAEHCIHSLRDLPNWIRAWG